MSSFRSYGTVKKVMQQVRPFWPHLIGLLLLNILTIPIALLKPLPLKIIIDHGLGSAPLPSWLAYFIPAVGGSVFASIAISVAVMVIGIALLDHLQGFLSWVWHAFTGERIVVDFKGVLFNHIQRMSIAYHDRKGSADALYRLQFDAPAIRTFLFSGVSPFVVSVFTLMGMLGVLTLLYWPFALMATALLPALYFIMQKGSAHLQSEWYDVKQNESKAMAVAYEVMGALRVVKAFGQETGESSRFVGQTRKAAQGQVRVAITGAKYYLYTGLIMAIAAAFFLYYGSLMVHAGRMSMGDLTLVVAYLAQIFSPMEKISKVVNEMPSSLSSIERVFSFLAQPKEAHDERSGNPILRASGHICYSHVGFAYAGKKKVLHDVSFELYPGQRLGVIGSTGSGKTTVVNLLMRFHLPTEGVITLDGQNIIDYRLSDYRNQFAMVLQEPVLFSSTIAENIAYGKRGATQEEIERAAKLANAHSFIMQLSDGYQTQVGERGMQLSGGERQRISIARAFIQNAPVLVLDEPTSSLDVETEHQIMEATERLMKGRTTFLITHRLEILNNCDVVIRLENGKIIETVRRPDSGYLDFVKDKFLKPA